MASELLKGDAKGKVHPDSRKAQQMSRAQRKEGNKAVRTKQRDKSKTEQVRGVVGGGSVAHDTKGSVPEVAQERDRP